MLAVCVLRWVGARVRDGVRLRELWFGEALVGGDEVFSFSRRSSSGVLPGKVKSGHAAHGGEV